MSTSVTARGAERGAARKTKVGRKAGLGRDLGTVRGDAVADALPPRDPQQESPPLDADDGPLEDDYGNLGFDDDDEPGGRDEVDSDIGPRRSVPRPEIELWVDRRGFAAFAVAEPDPQRLLDPALGWLMLQRYERLNAYGRYLCERLATVIAAPTLLAAYDMLPIATKADASAAMEVGPGQLSRDRAVLVAIPAGIVPSDFFTWKSSNDAIVTFLARQEDLLDEPATRLGERAAAECPPMSDGTPYTGNAVVPYVNWVRAAVAFPYITRTFSGRFLADPRDAERQVGFFARALDHATQADMAAGRSRDRKLKGKRVNGEVGIDRGVAILRRALLGGLL